MAKSRKIQVGEQSKNEPPERSKLTATEKTTAIELC